MADAPYLVALALVELQGQRALPLTGKSQAAAASQAPDPGDQGRTLALELLLRLWQRSDAGALQRVAGEESLLLLEIPLAGGRRNGDVVGQPGRHLPAGLANHDCEIRADQLSRLALRRMSPVRGGLRLPTPAHQENRQQKGGQQVHQHRANHRGLLLGEGAAGQQQRNSGVP